MSEENSTSQPKRKPVFFSSGTHLHNLSQSHEVDGFKQKSEHDEKVQSMLSKAVTSILWDIRKHPPKRKVI